MRNFQEVMTQKSPDTLERYIQVFATVNGGLTDVTLLNQRTLPDVPGNALHGVGAKSSVMERYWKTAIIEEKWLQKRKQEPDERRLQKKRRELTSEKGKAPDFQILPNSITNFDEELLKLEVLVALNFDKLMVARGWEKCADNDAQGFSEHRTADAKHCGFPHKQDYNGQTRATLW